MATVDEKAVEFIFGIVNSLDDEAEVLFDRHSVNVFVYRFKVISKGEKVDYQFSRALMDDFEIAIEKYKDTDCYYTLENALRFELYSGWIVNCWRISQALMLSVIWKLCGEIKWS